MQYVNLYVIISRVSPGPLFETRIMQFVNLFVIKSRVSPGSQFEIRIMQYVNLYDMAAENPWVILM